MKKIKLFAVLIILLFASTVYATNGMQVIGAGPIMRSMGGAGSALPLDTAVITVNPAGMSELDRRLDFGITYFIPDSDYESVDGMAGSSSAGSNTGASPMPAIGLIIPIDDTFTFGIGAYGMAGMGVDYEKGVYDHIVYSNFSMMKFIPSVSYKINDTFSVGAGINLNYASLGFAAGGASYDNNSQMGYGFQLGLFGKFTDKFSGSIGYISKQNFPDFRFALDSGTNKLNLDLPQNVILGLGYKVTPKLRIATDIKWINWSDTLGENLPEWTQNSNTAAPLNCDWDNQIVFAIGAEFDLNEAISLRAGYNYAKNPLSSSSAVESIVFPAIVESHFTAGLGWKVNEELSVNTGIMYAPEKTVSGSSSSQFITSYETSLSEISIELGISYKF